MGLAFVAGFSPKIDGKALKCAPFYASSLQIGASYCPL
jgi:hypothetical protein